MTYYHINQDSVIDVSEKELWDALKLYSETNDYDAEFVIVNYILNDYICRGIDRISDDELHEKFSELVVDVCLTNLSQKGLVDPSFDQNGEITYTVNNIGKEYYEKIKDSAFDEFI